MLSKMAFRVASRQATQPLATSSKLLVRSRWPDPLAPNAVAGLGRANSPKSCYGTSAQTIGASAQGNPTEDVRHPRAIQALHLKPLRRVAEYGVPSCDLQLRSYSLRPLEFFADFALRAAYYLNLPAYGPVPLPRITERWTVPKSTFIFKKSQENFERVTVRRLIQIRDGDPHSVQVWLAFLRKHAYYGVGMKANVWEFSTRGTGESMDRIDEEASAMVESTFKYFAQHRSLGSADSVEELLTTRKFKPYDTRTQALPTLE